MRRLAPMLLALLLANPAAAQGYRMTQETQAELINSITFVNLGREDQRPFLVVSVSDEAHYHGVFALGEEPALGVAWLRLAARVMFSRGKGWQVFQDWEQEGNIHTSALEHPGRSELLVVIINARPNQTWRLSWSVYPL